MTWDTFHHTKFLKAPSNLALHTSRDGAATASLGNLCQGLTTLMVKNFFLISSLNLPCFSLKPLPLVLSYNVYLCQKITTQFRKMSVKRVLQILQNCHQSPRS